VNDIPDCNLLVTTFKYREIDALDELLQILDTLGDRNPTIEISSISGIIIAKTGMDPLQVVEACRELVRNEPWSFRYVLRIIPLEKICRAELSEIHNLVKQLSMKIHDDETIKVIIEKRHTSLRSNEIISNVTSDLDIKVKLNDPNWIILIQIVNRLAGVSILRSDQIFSSVKEKISIQ
jgi:tRNA acetyltransferase TAN1